MSRKKYLQLDGDDWQKARMQALVRDAFCCQAHRLGITDTLCEETQLEELQVHHIRMRVHGGTHDLENLITLCKLHHEKLHPWMKRSFSSKPKVFSKAVNEL